MLLCATITIAALAVLRRHAARLELVAHPQSHHTHDTPTPVVGGLGMAFGLGVTVLVPNAVDAATGTIVGAVGLVLLGACDDRCSIPARMKFFAQAVIVALALALDNREVASLGELLPGLDLQMAGFALPFTVFAVLGVINATNMIDGLDGLAGKVILVAFGWIAVCLSMAGRPESLPGVLAVAGAIVAFLLFNARYPGRSRALMFMGDSGSMLLGFLLACVAIDATRGAHAVPPVTMLWICALPILDTLAVALERKLSGRSSMSCGRDHLHHLLRERGLSVCQVALAEAGLGAAFGLAGVVGWQSGAPDWLMFTLFAATGLAYHQLFRNAWAHTRSNTHPQKALIEANSTV